MSALPAAGAAACPWSALGADGAGLELEQFLSFHVVRLAHVLQRVSMRSYLEPHGLTIPDWRTLAFVQRYRPVPFAQLAARTSLDKAQLSRTVRSLRERGLIVTEGDAAHAQRVVLDITPSGRRLHARILPEAARMQAMLLSTLPVAAHKVLWRALHTLQVHAHAAAARLQPATATTRKKR